MDDRGGVRISFDPVSPAQSERHYGCFMLACRIPLKRLMPGSLSQPRTRYPPAACSDLVNEFISLVRTAASAPPYSVSFSAEWEWSLRASCQLLAPAKTSLQCNDSNFASWLESWCMHVRFSYTRMPLNFPQNVNFSRTMQNRKAMNPKVTSARGGENWFPHDNRDSFFTLAVSLSIFVCLPSLFQLQGGNAAPKKKRKNTLSIGLVLIMKLIIPRPKRRSLLQSSLSRG